MSMAYEEIKEKIKVLAIFKDGTVFPYCFDWQGKRRVIQRVNLAYQEREGSHINYYFAVEAKGLVGKIKYMSGSLVWELTEIWVD